MFGPPATADKAQLVIIMSGDYRAKKEVAHLLVPSVGRKVLDLGGNIIKGVCLRIRIWTTYLFLHSTDVQAHRQLDDLGNNRSSRRRVRML